MVLSVSSIFAVLVGRLCVSPDSVTSLLCPAPGEEAGTGRSQADWELWALRAIFTTATLLSAI